MRKTDNTTPPPTRLKCRGFTLIELLIVIAIIGGLSVLFINNFIGQQARARDARRQAELKQYQNALEVFAAKNSGFYPMRSSSSGRLAHTILCADLGLPECAADPVDKDPHRYRYQSNFSSGNSTGDARATQYVLWTALEGSEEYYVVCSTGQSENVPLSTTFSGGGCPL